MALISKILEETLTAGNTSVSFTDTAIPNSLIRVFSNNPDIIPVSRTLSGNTLTVTYEAQSNDLYVALEIVKEGLEVIDNVTSTNTDKALSANQGKVLKDAIDTISGNLTDLSNTVDNLDIPNNITDLDDVNVTSIQDGQVLAWDSDTSKFVNVDQSGGSSATVIKKNWTATTSSVTGSQLTELANLDAGKYIVNVHIPYSSNSSTSIFALAIDSALDNNQISVAPVSYGNCTFVIEKNASFTLKFVSATGNTLTWDSAYIDRGGMYIVKLP